MGTTLQLIQTSSQNKIECTTNTEQSSASVGESSKEETTSEFHLHEVSSDAPMWYHSVVKTKRVISNSPASLRTSQTWESRTKTLENSSPKKFAAAVN